MTYDAFKAYLVAFVQNSEASLTISATNIAELVIEQARLKAQRDHDFLSLLAKGGLNVSDYGTPLSSVMTVPEGATPYAFKSVRGCFEYTLNAGLTDWKPGRKYDLSDYSAWQVDAGIRTTIALYAVGRSIYSLNAGDTLWVGVLGIPWARTLDWAGGAGAYDTSTYGDVFSTEGVDWLLWECLNTLNGYLKEEERIPVSATMLNATWNSLIDYDKEVEVDYTNVTNLD